MGTLRTVVLLGALTGLLLAIGAIIGGPAGVIVAFIFASLMNFTAYWYSDKIVLAMYGAKEVSPAEAPRLHRIVERVAMSAGIPKPKVYIIPTETPNAFATGRDPNHAAVAVTQGILRLLDEDELEGVIGHEIAHIKNRDTLVSTVAATIAGAISMLAYMAQWAVLFSSRDRDKAEVVGALLMAIIAPIIATIIQLAISRTREFMADETGAKITHKPLALANALRKLEYAVRQIPMDANPATSHMFIVNPLSGRTIIKLFSTHPPTEERIRRLEKLAGVIR